jgi:hypothetical protein
MRSNRRSCWRPSPPEASAAPSRMIFAGATSKGRPDAMPKGADLSPLGLINFACTAECSPGAHTGF